MDLFCSPLGLTSFSSFLLAVRVQTSLILTRSCVSCCIFNQALQLEDARRRLCRTPLGEINLPFVATDAHSASAG